MHSGYALQSKVNLEHQQISPSVFNAQMQFANWRSNINSNELSLCEVWVEEIVERDERTLKRIRRIGDRVCARLRYRKGRNCDQTELDAKLTTNEGTKIQLGLSHWSSEYFVLSFDFSSGIPTNVSGSVVMYNRKVGAELGCFDFSLLP